MDVTPRTNAPEPDGSGIGPDDALPESTEPTEASESTSELACPNCGRSLLQCRDRMTGAPTCLPKATAMTVARMSGASALGALLTEGAGLATDDNLKGALGDLLLDAMERRVAERADKEALARQNAELKQTVETVSDRLAGRVRNDQPLTIMRGSMAPLSPRSFIEAVGVARSMPDLPGGDSGTDIAPVGDGGTVKVVGLGLDKTSAFWSTQMIDGARYPAQILLDIQRVYVEEGIEVVTFRKA